MTWKDWSARVALETEASACYPELRLREALRREDTTTLETLRGAVPLAMASRPVGVVVEHVYHGEHFLPVRSEDEPDLLSVDLRHVRGVRVKGVALDAWWDARRVRRFSAKLIRAWAPLVNMGLDDHSAVTLDASRIQAYMDEGSSLNLRGLERSLRQRENAVLAWGDASCDLELVRECRRWAHALEALETRASNGVRRCVARGMRAAQLSRHPELVAQIPSAEERLIQQRRWLLEALLKR